MIIFTKTFNNHTNYKKIKQDSSTKYLILYPRKTYTVHTALLAVHFQSNLPQTVSSSTIELNRFLAKMASEQRNKNTITLKGSSQLVAEYLSKSSNLTVECIS